MKAGPLILTCAAGLVAGVFLGIARHDADIARTPLSVAPPTLGIETGRTRPDELSPPADSDARIVRVFSALHEPQVLKSRHEFFHALADLTAQDLPSLI
ncbi:MAG: hypothetical protein ABI680_05100, partial [Chthoniobacteraceae bacterium]